MWLPASIGGTELPPLEFLSVIEELARQDGSVGWCVAIPAGYGRLAGAMPEDAARSVFGRGTGALVGSLNPTGKAVVVPGGYRVTGRWSYGSFIAHADWVLGNCITEDASGPRLDDDGSSEFRLCLFPSAAVEVFNIWHTGGLRATGGNDYAVADLFVPEDYSIPLHGFFPPPRQSGALFAMPMTSTFVSCIATVCLGIARATIESVNDIAATKATAGTRTVLRDKPPAQVEMARAEALLRAGRAYLFNELTTIWNDAQAGKLMTLGANANVRLAACHATQCAIQAVDLMYQLAGGASLFQGNRPESCFRDVHAGGQHIAVSPQAKLGRWGACCSACRRARRGSNRSSSTAHTFGELVPMSCVPVSGGGSGRRGQNENRRKVGHGRADAIAEFLTWHSQERRR
jgi:alkylation response protein AidB-like acyl-CoA dehydrogenase